MLKVKTLSILISMHKMFDLLTKGGSLESKKIAIR